MEKYILLALFAPLISSIFSAFFAMKEKRIITGIFSSFMLFLSTLASFKLLYHVYIDKNIFYLTLYDWIEVGNLSIPFGFVVDEISVIMMCVVTLVSTMVHIYSIGYMAHDKGFNRYFSYLSAFVFSMLILVMSDNFAGLFIGWEGVGLCSWLLIGFWYEKNSASFAANEAFIMNRMADLGMLLGIFLIYWNIGSLQYTDVFSNISNIDTFTTTLIAIFLFVGAMGKSAQFPFHTWLADAMEGPTPVSALIHAATMVTAGVYLLIRANEIYALVPYLGYLIAILGAFVAIFAASMAIVNNDMKRVIAYSTLSQLGYMFVAAGLQAYNVALFHLATHAFFKSVLFLGAGNVMHAMKDELDMRKMGGLYKNLKATAIIMILASLALSGIFPLSGFFSKDKILEVAFDSQHYFLYSVLLITAFLTAFYSFRLIMKIFFTSKKFDFEAHEAKPFVIASMLPLIFLALIAGVFQTSFNELLSTTLVIFEPLNLNHNLELILVICTSLISIFGILFAIFKYKNEKVKSEQGFIHKLLINQYYIPKIYENIVIKPYYSLSCFAFKKIDIKIIDTFVDFVARFIYKSGQKARVIQSGNLSSLIQFMILGFFIMLLFLLIFTLGHFDG